MKNLVGVSDLFYLSLGSGAGEQEDASEEVAGVGFSWKPGGGLIRGGGGGGKG